MTAIVDASVACKWFLAEAGTDEAVALMQSGEGLAAPDILIPEVCNVAWRKARTGEIGARQAEAMVAGLAASLDEIVPSAPLATQSLTIARELDHPVYDCFYLALAEQREVRLVTADARLIGRLAETPWAARVVSLLSGPGEP